MLLTQRATPAMANERDTKLERAPEYDAICAMPRYRQNRGANRYGNERQ